VHDLVHEVVQAALTGGPDVHAWPLAHGLEAFQDGDVPGVVTASRVGRGRWGLGLFHRGLVCHSFGLLVLVVTGSRTRVDTPITLRCNAPPDRVQVLHGTLTAGSVILP